MNARNVGLARAAGFAAVLQREQGRDPGHCDSRRPVPGDGHLHVHGANLGLRATAYLDAGGMPPLALAEDQALVDALRALGRQVVATGRIPVLTSSRRESRTAGGFADHLRELAG